MTQMFLDTHSGPQPCKLTGRTTTTKRGQVYVEIECAHFGGLWWTADYAVSSDPATFAGNTIAAMRARESA